MNATDYAAMRDLVERMADELRPARVALDEAKYAADVSDRVFAADHAIRNAVLSLHAAGEELDRLADTRKTETA